MEIVKQSQPDSHCGQCCLAMIAGKNLIDVFKKVGNKRRTTTKDLKTYLDAENISHSEKLKVVGKAGKNPYPYRGILKVTWFDEAKRINSRVIKKQSHWVVINYPYIFDPLKGKTKVADYLIMINELKGRITSFLKVEF